MRQIEESMQFLNILLVLIFGVKAIDSNPGSEFKLAWIDEIKN